MPRPGRRLLIADAAIELAAAGGNHAVTHRAIDQHLGLPNGSTSYYFRTRGTLIAAAADRLIAVSQGAFSKLTGSADRPPIEVIADYTTELVTERRAEVLARQALLLETGLSADVHERLARCFFSVPAATALMAGRPAPAVAANQLITVLEGIVFAHTQGADATRTRGRRRAIRGLLAETCPHLVDAE
ncbi:TetR/AcrR family transcriptional regulator [Gordonia sp. DT30]|uniref:TetR/AcrR family transcriptional regulator n=1 Tax=Gordonia sp. DT30 TaxID=3416546 RepID=UPI003CE8D683